ncbi:MAG: hypothetical protein IJ699_05005 [Bacteroidaceae bacterium]|nr:hypothetical protein [Bacteroidaceae bacterium]
MNLRFSQRKASKNAGGRTKTIKITFLREENEKNEGREKAAKRENMFHSQKTLTLFGAITIKKYTKVLPEVPETAPRTPKTPLQVGNSKTS